MRDDSSAQLGCAPFSVVKSGQHPDCVDHPRNVRYVLEIARGVEVHGPLAIETGPVWLAAGLDNATVFTKEVTGDGDRIGMKCEFPDMVVVVQYAE